MSPEDKIVHIIRNSACVIRIGEPLVNTCYIFWLSTSTVPTRSTSYTHLRDAFVRALQARLAAAIKEGIITEETAQAASSPMRSLKSLFPNAPLAKHSPLDIFLAAPLPNRPRPLVFRDLGSIESDWLTTEFFLYYFDKDGPSPPVGFHAFPLPRLLKLTPFFQLKESAFESIRTFSK